MINQHPLTVLDRPDEVDTYLKTTGNFVRLSELKDAMRESHNGNGLCTLHDDRNHAFLAVGKAGSAILLIDRNEIGFQEAFALINRALQMNGAEIDVQVRNDTTNN